MQFPTSPPDLQQNYNKIDQQTFDKSRKKLEKDSKNNQRILEDLNSKTFDLQKNILIVVGTIFGSSIALASGQDQNYFFIFGEVFLLISIFSGLILLASHLRSIEWEYAFFSKMLYESHLFLHKDKIEQFIADGYKDLIKDFNKIIDKNQSGTLYKVLRIIPVDKWPTIANTSFLIGSTLILLSLLDF